MPFRAARAAGSTAAGVTDPGVASPAGLGAVWGFGGAAPVFGAGDCAFSACAAPAKARPLVTSAAAVHARRLVRSTAAPPSPLDHARRVHVNLPSSDGRGSPRSARHTSLDSA